MRNLRTLKFELIAIFRNGGLTSGTELIRVKAPAAQRLGGGNALSLSMLNRARFFEGPLLSKCRVGQAYERFSPPLFSPSGKPVGIFSTHYRKPHRPHERVLQLLDLLARQGADVIERAQMGASNVRK